MLPCIPRPTLVALPRDSGENENGNGNGNEHSAVSLRPKMCTDFYGHWKSFVWKCLPQCFSTIPQCNTSSTPWDFLEMLQCLSSLLNVPLNFFNKIGICSDLKMVESYRSITSILILKKFFFHRRFTWFLLMWASKDVLDRALDLLALELTIASPV